MKFNMICIKNEMVLMTKERTKKVRV